MAASQVKPEKTILILGCGVIGLTTGITLLKHGYKNVTIWTKDVPPHTTSNKAAAVWYPFLANPPERVAEWSRRTLESYLHEGFVDDPSTGVAPNITKEFFPTKKKSVPTWAYCFSDRFRRLKPHELAPFGNRFVDGYHMHTVIINTDQFMQWLYNNFLALGGTIELREVNDIHADVFAAGYRVVINCTGLGSRKLFNDEYVYPCRGQIVRLAPIEGVKDSLFDEESGRGVIYVIPRQHDIVVGGTAYNGDWNTAPDPEDTENILRMAGRVEPRITRETAKILEVKVGLRPARHEIRLEAEEFPISKTGERNQPKAVVIHNYGHGGSGFTVAWGCAYDVLAIVNNLDEQWKGPLERSCVMPTHETTPVCAGRSKL